MDENERRIRKELKIPLGADVQIIDLDLQKKTPEMVTAGWTDTQIKNKGIQEIDALIHQNELALKSMEEAVFTQRENLSGLRQVRNRKLLIGGS